MTRDTALHHLVQEWRRAPNCISPAQSDICANQLAALLVGETSPQTTEIRDEQMNADPRVDLSSHVPPTRATAITTNGDAPTLNEDWRRQTELAEARATIKRINRRCQLAEAALNTKVEHFEQRSRKGLRAYYYALGVNFREASDRGKAAYVPEDFVQQLRDAIGAISPKLVVWEPPAVSPDSRVEPPRARHIALNVALRRAGYGHATACDGPDCVFCRIVLAAPVPSPAPAVSPPGLDYKALYFELLFQVGIKHPNETRHETALRYLRRAEEGSSQACSALPSPPVAARPREEDTKETKTLARVDETS